tara:strand:+ start:16 stop:516 length:501 start_codon:yes stop_codon:yes gene_type:complete
MNNRFPNRRWCIINSGDVSSVNFGQVLESSAQTCRYSVDGSKTFVKYNITEYPVSHGTDDAGSVVYADNVDAAGNTYNMYYEQVGTDFYPLYSDQQGQGHVVTGSGSMPRYGDTPTGSGIAYASGAIAGRPDIYSSALTVSGKTEFNHPEILGILGTEDWTSTGIF